MGKSLVAYFSATGTTKRAAQALAKAAGADLFEIEPAEPYTAADLDWTDKNSRSTREMGDAKARPAIASAVADMGSYDTVFLGFPIWWYVEPRIIDTFAESYDFSGKTVVPFATSGGSSLGEAPESLRAKCAGRVLDGFMLNGALDEKAIAAKLADLGL